MLFETAVHARTPLHLAGSVTGLVGLHVSCFPSGKMKWFGGDKGKDVKCLKLPEGIVSITFPYLYKNKITHICISCMYVYTQRKRERMINVHKITGEYRKRQRNSSYYSWNFSLSLNLPQNKKIIERRHINIHRNNQLTGN